MFLSKVKLVMTAAAVVAALAAGDEVEYEFRPPEEAMRKLRNHAE